MECNSNIPYNDFKNAVLENLNHGKKYVITVSFLASKDYWTEEFSKLIICFRDSSFGTIPFRYVVDNGSIDCDHFGKIIGDVVSINFTDLTNWENPYPAYNDYINDVVGTTDAPLIIRLNIILDNYGYDIIQSLCGDSLMHPTKDYIVIPNSGITINAISVAPDEFSLDEDTWPVHVGNNGKYLSSFGIVDKRKLNQEG